MSSGGHTEIAENFEGLAFEFVKAQIKVKVDSILIMKEKTSELT